jgi:predicted DsbA family dithiol-disulfide isomerase
LAKKLKEPITIEVFSDLVCPWCRIGKKHLDDALAAWTGGQEEPGIQLVGSGEACGAGDEACGVDGVTTGGSVSGSAGGASGASGAGSAGSAEAETAVNAGTAANADVHIVYRAFQLDPSTPVEGAPFRESLAAKFGGMAVVDQMTGRVTEAGAASGITFRFDRIEKSPNTILGHRLIALAPAEKREALVDAYFRAHFEEGEDIGELDRLIAIAEGLGLDGADLRSRLAAGDGTADVQADFDRARRIGVTGVPFFVFGGKYAVSGAYPPAELIRILDKVADEQGQA